MALTKERLKLFKEFTQTIAISGQERSMAHAMRRYLEPLSDTIEYDALGSLIALKKSKQPNAPKVMVVGHLDEVGFLVKEIMSDGALKIEASGGVWEQVVLSQRVQVQSRTGDIIDGVIASTPPHLLTDAERGHPTPIASMFVDLGTKSEKETRGLGIQEGSAVVMRGDFVPLHKGKRLLAKAFDNRYGCILGVEVMQSLKDIELPYDLYVVGSVQEEVGLRGAQTVAQKLTPDFAFVLDCSPANDIGGNTANLGRLGEGVLIRFLDGTMIAFPELMDWQIETCKKEKVKYQFYQSPGGTDAGSIHKANDGIMTLTHCVCARNIHSSGSVLDLDDYEAAKKSLLSMLMTLTPQKLNEFHLAKR